MDAQRHGQLREDLKALGIDLEELQAFKAMKKRKVINEVMRAACLYAIDLESEVKIAQQDPDRYHKVMGLLESLQEMHEKLRVLGL